MVSCAICHRHLWPWQRQGHRALLPGDVVRWHRSCFRVARQVALIEFEVKP